MNNKQEKLANKCDCCNKAPCECPPNCSCGCKNKTAASKPGLWANIHAKKQRGEAPAKPGDKDYPDAKNWKKVTQESEKKAAPAWQTSEGKSESGGLNDKGRASLKAQGHDIKRPQPEGGPRKDSFCARMKGMKAKLTSEETARDPDSRINKALRKWKCGSAEKLASLLKQSRCWEGYEAVPGKKPYSEDSCRPVGSASKPQKKKEPKVTSKEAADMTADDILNSSGWSPALSDYLGSTSAHNRAGRGRAVAKALDQEIPFTVNRPIVSSLLSALGGGVAGSGLGLAAGSALGAGKPMSAAIGGSLGTILGALAAQHNRHSHLTRLSEDLDNAMANKKKLKVKKPEAGLANLVPFVGSGRAGETQAYLQMKNKDPKHSGVGEIATEEVIGRIPYLGTLMSPVLSSAQGYNALSELRKDERKSEKKAAQKKANAVTNLLNRIRPYLPTKRQAAIGAGTTAGTAGGIYLGNKLVNDVKEHISSKARALETFKNLPNAVADFAKEKANAGSANWSMDPAIANAIVGAGGGALLGAGIGAVSPRDKRKSLLSNMLTYGGMGALGGAGVGGGLTESLRYLTTRPGTANDDFFRRMAKDTIHNLDRKQQYGLIAATGGELVNNPATNFVQGLGQSAGLQY